MPRKTPTPAVPPVEQPQQPAEQEPQAPVDAPKPEDSPAPPDDSAPVETPVEQPQLPVEEAPVVATPPAPEPDPEPAPAAPVEVEPLATYAARIEEAAQPLPVCQITHPDAKDGGLHVGKYAGIRLVRGDIAAALLSNGSTI